MRTLRQLLLFMALGSIISLGTIGLAFAGGFLTRLAIHAFLLGFNTPPLPNLP